MSKITINTICAILRLLISVLGKSVRLIYTIIDFVDDGVINQSVPKPEWYGILCSAIASIEDVISHVSGIEDVLTLPSSNVQRSEN